MWMRKEVLAVGPDTSILDLAEMMMGQKAQDLILWWRRGACSGSSTATM